MATPFSHTGSWRSSSGVREARLEHLKRLAQAPVRLIDLVEKQDARRPQIFQLTKNDLKRWDLARIGLRGAGAASQTDKA